ncbi:MAG: hypothetical protein BA867_01195 [Desulfobacterales bacterium S5133MH16]|nr:MAG: hypothetical protein BA867_01195 [Desulfobacterales bacterium S5133MH16]
MDTAILTAMIAAVVAIISAVISIIGQIRVAKLNAKFAEKKEARGKRQQAEDIISKYREPLAHSAYDLQAKLFNIMRQGLLQVYYVKGNESEREYTLQNTIYVIAQYLCWREIIRREIQFFDLGEIESTQKLTELMDHIQMLFLTDGLDPVFRIFRGEQRAIGEKMIISENDRQSCLGYATFVENQDDSFRRWFRQLEKDVELLSKDALSHGERLILLHHALIDLIDYLDPDCLRFQAKYRTKI